MLIGIAIEIPFAIGEMILGLQAYFIRDWKTLQMVAYLPVLCKVQFVISKCDLLESSSAWPVLYCARVCPLADRSRQD